MPTVIDSLTVLLNLDPKKFTEGQKQASEQLKALDKQADANAKNEGTRSTKSRADQARNLREQDQRRQDTARKDQTAARETAKVETESTKRRAEGLTLAKEAALGFGAALAAVGIEKFVTSTVQSVAETTRFADSLGLGAVQVKTWGEAIEQSVGGSAKDAIGTIGALTMALVRMRTGADPALLGAINEVESFTKKRLNLTGADGKPIGAMELLQQVGANIQGLDPKLQQDILSKFGVDGGTARFLQKGPGFDAGALSLAAQNQVTKEQADADVNLAAAAAAAELALDHLGQQLVFDITPNLTLGLKNFGLFLDMISGKISPGDALSQFNKNSHDAGRGPTPFDKDYWTWKNWFGPKVVPDATTPPAGTTEDKPGFWEGLGNKLGIHFFRSNAAAGLSGSAGGGLPADVEAEVRNDAIALGKDPDQAVALFRQEGGGYSNVNPKSGAFGSAQLLPSTARDLGVADSVNSPNYDWRENVMAGIKYWAQGVDKFGGNYLAGAAAYHDGPNSAAVARYAQTGDPSGLTAEGQDYINSISHMSRPGALVNGGSFPGTRNTLGDYPGGANVSTSEVNIGTVVVRGDPNTAHGVANGVRKALAQTVGFNQAYSGII